MHYTSLMLLSLAIHCNVASSYDDRLPPAMNKLESIKRMEISGPLFGLLRKFQPSLNLRDIDNEIVRAISEGVEELTAMQSVSRLHKLNLKTVRLMDPSPSRVPIPSLLLVSRIGRSGQQGVFVLVEAVGDNSFQVFDFQSGKGRGFLSFSDLPIIWSGDVLYISTETATISRLLEFVFVGLSLFVLTVIFWQRFRSKRRSLEVISLCYLCLSVFSGCGESHSATESDSNKQVPFAINGPSIIELGQVSRRDENIINFDFSLTVTNKHPIRVSSLLGNCSCLLIESGVVGKKFNFGDSINVQGKLDLNGKVGEEMLIIQIFGETEDNSAFDPVKIGLRYFVEPEPKLSMNLLELSGLSGKPSVEGHLAAYMVRKSNQPPLALDRIKSPNDFVRLKRVSELETVELEGSNLVKDKLEITLIANSDQEFNKEQIHFFFKSFDRPINVDVLKKTIPGIAASPSRFFLGTLNLDESRSKQIELTCTPGAVSVGDPVAVSVSGEETRIVSTNWEQNEIHIKFETTCDGKSEPGRHENVVQIKVGDLDSNSISIPVAWITKAKQ